MIQTLRRCEKKIKTIPFIITLSNLQLSLNAGGRYKSVAIFYMIEDLVIGHTLKHEIEKLIEWMIVFRLPGKGTIQT